MKTTVMFVADSVPLDGAEVWLVGGGDDERGTTDPEGKVEFDLAAGTHTFRVMVDDEWHERTIKREGTAPLFVVNIEQRDAQRMATLNTLQIDLANLVGDRYVFETVLGRGGMGVVVKAVDRMLNRPVAIKMLSDELRENEEAQQIFLVEARSLATLSHPNLVAIHDILNVGGRVLMVFEYVLGENIEKMIRRRGSVEQLDALRIGIQLTRVVSYLHEHDLIHRDLKPANIIAQADGTMKLIDFGLARSLNEIYVRGTRVRGTPAYMAPEQVQGVHLTTATDLYQLGITFYEMLSGELPFTSGDMAYAHVHLDPPSLLEKVPELDPEFARLVHACLAKRPKDRPANVEVVLEQLQQIYSRLTNVGRVPGLGQASSGTFDAFESPSGSFEAISTVSEAAMPSSGTFEVAEYGADLSEVSIVSELSGGSNRGLVLVAVVGLVALIGAVAMLMPGDEAEPAAEVAPVALEAPPAKPEPVEEAEPPSLEDSIAGARGSILQGQAAALVEAVSVAAKSVEPEPEVRRVKRRRPVTKVKPAPVAARPKPAKPEEKAEQKPQNGLLSIDSGQGSKLLPVGE